MAVQKPPRKHHYVPQCLLQYFTDDSECLHYFDRRSGKILYEKPKNIFFEKEFYSSISYEDGAKDASLEIDWTQKLDGELASFVKHMVTSVRDGTLPKLSSQEKERWDYLIVFLARRIPSFNAILEDGFKRRWETEYPTIAMELNMSDSEFEKYRCPKVAYQNAMVADLPHPPEVWTNRLGAHGLVFGQLRTSAKIGWIIASNPFLYCPTDNHCWLPLAPDIAVSPCSGCTSGSERVALLSADEVRDHNTALFEQSCLIAAAHKELLEKLVCKQ